MSNIANAEEINEEEILYPKHAFYFSALQSQVTFFIFQF